jgi:hypothetical protein
MGKDVEKAVERAGRGLEDAEKLRLLLNLAVAVAGRGIGYIKPEYRGAYLSHLREAVQENAASYDAADRCNERQSAGATMH